MKKKINIPLIVVTIIIWGIIVYTIAEVIWFNIDEENIENQEPDLEYEKKMGTFSDPIFLFEYIDRDPFVSVQKKKIEVKQNVAPTVTKEIKVEEPLIKYSVGGVVINGENKKIVFNDETNSNVVFLQEGDAYQGLRVLKVTKYEVVFLQITTGNKLVSQIQ